MDVGSKAMTLVVTVGATVTEVQPIDDDGVSGGVADHRAAIFGALRGLNVDELAVVLAIVRRLWKGRETYGTLCLENKRDLDRELGEELLDFAVYREMLALQRRGAVG